LDTRGAALSSDDTEPVAARRWRIDPILGAALAAIACAFVAACFVVPYLGAFVHDGLVKTCAWGLAVLASCAGWGTLIGRRCWPNQRIGISLRAVWGASFFAAVGGLAAMVGGVSRFLILGWLLAGAGLLAHAAIVGRLDLAREARARLRATRMNLPFASVLVFVAAAVVVHYVGGASDVSSNPYDDDIAYYPFAKQLLASGTLIDPFSFRRMSTLGGQALFHAALLVRVQVAHLNVFDRGMCFILAVGLLASHRSVSQRKPPALARVLSVVFLVVLPNTSINSASYYSGLAFFLGFYQTLERLPVDLSASLNGTSLRATSRRLLPLALVGAALCTFRQNYQATVGVVLVLSYALAALRLRKTGVRAVLVEGTVCLALVGLLVLPWLVLLYRSSETFLFPIMQGTFRSGVSVQSKSMGMMRFIRFFTDVWLHPDPILTLPIFVLVGLFVRETSPRRPLAAQWLGAFVGIVLLSHAFSLADAGNLGRYDYGFVAASALLTWQTVATRASEGFRSNRFASAAPVALLVFALAAPSLDPQQAERTKKMISTLLRDTSEQLRRSVPEQTEPPIAAVYARLQAVVPSGARLLIMLDEPYRLDYRRNEIWNLDLPGSASPKPEMPCFQGAEPFAAYLIKLGIRHVAFVQEQRSLHLYGRGLWFDRVWSADEIWRVYAPYVVDVIDNLTALSRTRAHLFDEAGMIVLDLETKQ
jgi:hypothetical protein